MADGRGLPQMSSHITGHGDSPSPDEWGPATGHTAQVPAPVIKSRSSADDRFELETLEVLAEYMTISATKSNRDPAQRARLLEASHQLRESVRNRTITSGESSSPTYGRIDPNASNSRATTPEKSLHRRARSDPMVHQVNRAMTQPVLPTDGRPIDLRRKSSRSGSHAASELHRKVPFKEKLRGWISSKQKKRIPSNSSTGSSTFKHNWTGSLTVDRNQRYISNQMQTQLAANPSTSGDVQVQRKASGLSSLTSRVKDVVHPESSGDSHTLRRFFSRQKSNQHYEADDEQLEDRRAKARQKRLLTRQERDSISTVSDTKEEKKAKKDEKGDKYKKPKPKRKKSILDKLRSQVKKENDPGRRVPLSAQEGTPEENKENADLNVSATSEAISSMRLDAADGADEVDDSTYYRLGSAQALDDTLRAEEEPQSREAKVSTASAPPGSAESEDDGTPDNIRRIVERLQRIAETVQIEQFSNAEERRARLEQMRADGELLNTDDESWLNQMARRNDGELPSHDRKMSTSSSMFFQPALSANGSLQVMLTRGNIQRLVQSATYLEMSNYMDSLFDFGHQAFSRESLARNITATLETLVSALQQSEEVPNMFMQFALQYVVERFRNPVETVGGYSGMSDIETGTDHEGLD